MDKTGVRVLLVLIVVVCIVAGIAWYSYERNAGDTTQTPAATQLSTGPDSRPLTDFSGQEIDFASYEGKVIVAHSWATWVPSSKTTLELLNTAAANYNQESVVFLAINRAEPIERAEQFLRSDSYEHLVFIADADDRYFKNSEAISPSETIVYDQAGDVVYHERAQLIAAKLEQEIQALLDSE